jgi:cobalt-zinc-cadmium efflux system membrane fusion protein
MFSSALINVWGPAPAIVVPKSAVQWEGCCNVVFVKISNVQFEPRKIRLGFDTGPWRVVETGLVGGEQVVTTGSFLLKTELLKGSIGAGCCEIEPGKS